MTGNWSVYMIECVGGKIYTGVARDAGSRFRVHASGRGAFPRRIGNGVMPNVTSGPVPFIDVKSCVGQ